VVIIDHDRHLPQPWLQNREIINLVVGAILGAYLGLSISREGLSDGSYFDLFFLISFTAFSSSHLIDFGNSWFVGDKKMALFHFVAFVLLAAVSLRSAGNLGIDTKIFVTIYGAWAALVIAQVFASGIARALKSKLNDD